MVSAFYKSGLELWPHHQQSIFSYLSKNIAGIWFTISKSYTITTLHLYSSGVVGRGEWEKIFRNINVKAF
jgi:hypothetical protein